jgi:hypothetical protein
MVKIPLERGLPPADLGAVYQHLSFGPEALQILADGLAGAAAALRAAGFAQYRYGSVDPAGQPAARGGVTIDGECVEITGLLEAPDGAQG